MAVVEDGGGPLIISADENEVLRGWRLASTLAALERSTAAEVEVRQLSLGSLEVVVQLPADVLAETAILDAKDRLAGARARHRGRRLRAAG